MTPFVTIWPTKATEKLSKSICDKMLEDGFDSARYKNILYSEASGEGLSEKLLQSFKTLVNLDVHDATLNVVAFVEVFGNDCVDAVARLTDAITKQTDSFALHVFCLQSGLLQAMGLEKSEVDVSAEEANIKDIASLLSKQQFRAIPIVIDDYLANGVPVSFTHPLLVRFLTTLLRSMTENYSSVFPNVITTDSDTVWSMGISQAKFDRRSIADYLLHRAFVSALDSVGITQEQVDIPAASLRADKCLDGVAEFYQQEYDKHVVPLLEQKKDEKEIAAQIPSLIVPDVLELREKLTTFLNDDTLSLPEKEATFAMLLGRDNERLSGALYDGKKNDFDDVLAEPLDIYLSSYNSLAVDTGLLPGMGECEYFRLPDIVDGEETIPDPRNNLTINPLPELKKLKSLILDQTAFIREQNDKLKQLQKIVEGQRRSEQVLVNGNVKGLISYDVVEQPLAEIYEPKAALVVKKEVDLRPLCSSIRDQGQIGSCSSFAVTAMYEMIVNALHKDLGEKSNLSEHFLFYHSNVINGKVEGGSNYNTQLGVLGQHGICSEELYPYSVEEIEKAPSEVAIKDAELHRVLCAKQIPLKSDGNKFDNIKENHRLLTSALSEGYAVGFALKIYDDFGKGDGGFVPLPTPADDEEPGYHAMVLVGYSEAQKCYIVRNSWGESFGDNGYCYVSSVYVDDPEYITFACIITETTEGDAATVVVPSQIVKFGKSESLIQMAAIINTVDEAKIKLAYLKECYDSIYLYYSILLQESGEPETRNVIRQRRQDALAQAVAEKTTQRDALLAAFAKKMNDFKKRYIGKCIYTTLAAVAALVAVILMYVYGVALIPYVEIGAIVVTVVLVIVSVLLWISYASAVRRYRKELQEEVDAVSMAIARLKKEALVTQIKFYTAGVVIDKVQKMKLDLEERYQSLVSYVKNLAIWHKEDQEQQDNLETGDEKMFINLINHQLLDKYFEDNCTEICEKINFIERFKTFKITETSLQDLRQDLESLTRGVLYSLLCTFSMCDYILQKVNYPYLGSPDAKTIFSNLNKLCQLTTRNNYEQESDKSRNLTIAHSTILANELHKVYDRYFGMPPQLLTTADKDALTVYVSGPIPIERLII